MKLCPHNVGSESICAILGLCSITKRTSSFSSSWLPFLNELNITSCNFLKKLHNFLVVLGLPESSHSPTTALSWQYSRNLRSAIQCSKRSAVGTFKTCHKSRTGKLDFFELELSNRESFAAKVLCWYFLNVKTIQNVSKRLFLRWNRVKTWKTRPFGRRLKSVRRCAALRFRRSLARWAPPKNDKKRPSFGRSRFCRFCLFVLSHFSILQIFLKK